MGKEISLDKRRLQQSATLGNRVRRIMALEKVAGVIPVGDPPGESPQRRAKRSKIGRAPLRAGGSPNGIGNAIRRNY